MRIALVVAIVCLTVADLAVAVEAHPAGEQHAKVYELNIPRQSLDQALKDFAQQTGLQVARMSDAVSGGALVGPVEGSLSVEQALTSMLAAHGLTYKIVDNMTIAVVNVKAKAVSRVIGTLVGEETATTKLELARSFASSDEGRTPSSTEEDGDESKKSESLQEIIVTATKRAESVQDVPMSVSAITAEEIDRRGLLSAEDYLRGMPGVAQVGEIQGNQTIIIRGLNTGGQNYFNAPTVATYFGETPTTSSAGMSFDTSLDLMLVDIERVEVLRGPQGTAFGSSSLGGVVRSIPVTPKLNTFEGKVGANYSVTSAEGGNNFGFQGVLNAPVIQDRLALRATAYQYVRDGIYRNVAGSDPAVQAMAAQFGAQSFAVNGDIGDDKVTGGRIAALFQASEDFSITLSYLTQETETDGFPFMQHPIGKYDQAVLQVAPEHAIRGERAGVFDGEIDIANALLEYDFGWANLVATHSYLSSGSRYVQPLSIYGLGPTSYYSPSEHRGHISELRMTTQLDGAWNFLGGVYLEDLDDEATWEPIWYGSAASNFWAPGQTGRIADPARTRRNLKQKAVFAEASWQVLSRLTLTGGARLYDYERSQRDDFEGFWWGSVHESFSAGASDTNFSGSASYKLTEDALLYARFAQGFRLGRGQSRLPIACDANGDGTIDGTSITLESTSRINSDSVENFELGGKLTLLDRRLTVAADVFRIDWSGVPATVDIRQLGGPGLDTGCYPLFTGNIASARSQGVELEANFQATEAFRIDVGASWINAELTRDVQTLGAFEGSRLPGSPEYNASLALQYEFEIAGSAAYVRADSIYVGDYGGLNVAAANGDYVKVDASARVAFKHLDVELFVRNLTNADAFTAGGLRTDIFSFRLRPRTVGLQLTHNFGGR